MKTLDLRVHINHGLQFNLGTNDDESRSVLSLQGFHFYVHPLRNFQSFKELQSS